MTKFSAQSINDLRTPEATAGRLARKARFVVDVEVDDGSWCELDADDRAHAIRLAHHWVDPERGHARGASCWEVIPETGAVKRRSFFNIYAPIAGYPFEEDTNA
jgi:hypothetical protein